MMYIENIFICISIPLLLSLLFIQGETRKYTLFVCIGMGICVLSAYVSSFFMNYYGVDTIEASIEIAPVCEMAPGTVLSEIDIGNRTFAVITKSGGFGGETLMVDLAEKITGSKEDKRLEKKEENKYVNTVYA